MTVAEGLITEKIKTIQWKFQSWLMKMVGLQSETTLSHYTMSGHMEHLKEEGD